jgi:hypothetical protein
MENQLGINVLRAFIELDFFLVTQVGRVSQEINYFNFDCLTPGMVLTLGGK